MLYLQLDIKSAGDDVVHGVLNTSVGDARFWMSFPNYIGLKTAGFFIRGCDSPDRAGMINTTPTFAASGERGFRLIVGSVDESIQIEVDLGYPYKATFNLEPRDFFQLKRDGLFTGGISPNFKEVRQ